MSHTENVAVYGLGNMGYPIARRLARHFSIQVADLDSARVERARAELSAMPIRDGGDLSDTRVVILSLPSPKASLAVLRQIASHLPADAVVVETSTVNPEDVQACAALLESTGIRIIDASVMAGVSQMESGDAMLLVGGEPGAVAQCAGVLDAIAPRQINFGGLGAGAAAKVINNAVAHAVMVVVAEAGSMATAAGVDCDKLVQLLSDSRMGLHRPLTYRYAQRIMQDDYEGGMPLDAARKDSVLALALGQNLGVPLFAIQASHSVYEMATTAGYGRDDYAAIAKLWSDWGRPVAPASADA